MTDTLGEQLADKLDSLEADAGLIEDIKERMMQTALEAVELIARKILRGDPKLEAFTMGMGSWTFTGPVENRTYGEEEDGHYWTGYTGDTFHLSQDSPKAKPLADFLDQYDEPLNITGEPMRFTTVGPLVTKW